jgi:hypothetical protein
MKGFKFNICGQVLKFKALRSKIFVYIMLGDVPMCMGRLSKLGLKKQLLCFILFMKHDNVTIYDAFMWN